jgi:hypothetical protein
MFPVARSGREISVSTSKITSSISSERSSSGQVPAAALRRAPIEFRLLEAYR